MVVRCIVGESFFLLLWKVRDIYIKLEILLIGDYVIILILFYERYMIEIWFIYLCIFFFSNRIIYIYFYLKKGYMFLIVRVNNIYLLMLVIVIINFCF